MEEAAARRMEAQEEKWRREEAALQKEFEMKMKKLELEQEERRRREDQDFQLQFLRTQQQMCTMMFSMQQPNPVIGSQFAAPHHAPPMHMVHAMPAFSQGPDLQAQSQTPVPHRLGTTCSGTPFEESREPSQVPEEPTLANALGSAIGDAYPEAYN